MTGEPTNHEAIFIMRHLEDEIASLTLNNQIFQEVQSKVV